MSGSAVERLKQILKEENKAVAPFLLKALEESEQSRKQTIKATEELLDELEKAYKKIAILETANKRLQHGKGIAYLVVDEPPEDETLRDAVNDFLRNAQAFRECGELTEENITPLITHLSKAVQK